MKEISYIILGTVFMLMSCSSSANSDSKDAGGFELKDLLTEQLVRDTFNIPQSTDVKMEIDDPEVVEKIITYNWTEITKGNKPGKFCTVSLNFASMKKMSEGSLNSIWESQNEGVYKDRGLQKVSGVGDRASWSTLGGGQLRVAHNGYLFYVSLSIYNDGGAWTSKKMIEKCKKLAKGIISNI